MNCVSHVTYVLILRPTFSTHNMCMTSCSCLLLAITLQIVTDLGFVYTAVVLHSDTMGGEKKCIFFKKYFVFFDFHSYSAFQSNIKDICNRICDENKKINEIQCQRCPPDIN